MSDPIVFTLDCTDRFFELDASASPWEMFKVAGELPANSFFLERSEKFFASPWQVFPNCTDMKLNENHPQYQQFITKEEREKVRDKEKTVQLAIKSPLVVDTDSIATLFYITVPKDYVTHEIRTKYKVSDSFTYNNITYNDAKVSYILLSEGQSILLDSSKIDLFEYGDFAIIPGSRPAYLIVSVVNHCPEYKQDYIFEAKVIMASKEAMKNYPIEKAQKMFGIKPNDQKTGMLEFGKPTEPKLGFLPGKKVQTSAVLGG